MQNVITPNVIKVLFQVKCFSLPRFGSGGGNGEER